MFLKFLKNWEKNSLFKKLSNKWFTLIELIVVMVIIAILWAIWYNSFFNYYYDAKLTDHINKYSSLRNSLQASFSKDFIWENGVTYANETGYFAVTSSPGGWNFYAAQTNWSISVNAEKAYLTRYDHLSSRMGKQILVDPTEFQKYQKYFPYQNLVVVGWNWDWWIWKLTAKWFTFYYKIFDSWLCESKAFDEASIKWMTLVKWFDDAWNYVPCVMYNTTPYPLNSN